MAEEMSLQETIEYIVVNEYMETWARYLLEKDPVKELLLIGVCSGIENVAAVLHLDIDFEHVQNVVGAMIFITDENIDNPN